MSRNEGRTYAAPALSKGLEILELLARSPRALTQGEIASACGRSVSEQFRMLAVLQSADYVRRDEVGGYQLTLKLFSLGNGIPVLDTLVSSASGPMRAYVAATGQECHLSCLESGRLIVLAQEMGRTEITLHVRKGTECHPFRTASGRLLLSRSSATVIAEQWELACRQFPDLPLKKTVAMQEVKALEGETYSRAKDESLVGISDCAVDLGSERFRVALASSWFHASVSSRTQKTIGRELRRAAGEIQKTLGL